MKLYEVFCNQLGIKYMQYNFDDNLWTSITILNHS